MDRRKSLKNLGLLSAGMMIAPSLFAHPKALKGKTILLVSGWQYYNIGDIAHTPGLLQLLNLYLPETKVILWPNHEVRSIDEMLLQHFPDLRIVNGELIEGEVGSEAVLQAAQEVDFLLHGSGPAIVGQAKVAWWKEKIGKPYGIYGTTISFVNDRYRDLIGGADFLFTRETHSIEKVQEEMKRPPKTVAFGPDATFAMHLQDPIKAQRFMQEKGLETGKFICVVPRLRKTPYYQIYPEWNWTDERIRKLDALNDEHKEKDHAKAREAIITWVRQTGHKVLICPEMTYQLEVQQELLFDPLPPDVKSHVVLRDSYWLCDEAASVYREAVAVLSFECHSPIMACFNGTPAFYLRQPEDTIKGQMWYDIGLDDWVFEIEETTGAQISERLMEVYDHPEKAQSYLETAMDYVREVQYENMTAVRKVWG